MNEADKWKKRYERERRARFEAERLLEEKSLDLFMKSEQLDKLVKEQKQTIKERTQDYESATAEAQLLSDAVSNTENSVIITGKDNKVIWANKAIEKISGYKPEELIGKIPGRVLQGNRTNNKVRDYMREHIKSRTPFETDILNYHKNGTPYWVRLQATPVFDGQNEFKYFVAIQSDITENRKTNEKLAREIKRANQMAKEAEEANMAKTKFLTLMSHELRTPLNSIIGYAQILEKKTDFGSKEIDKIRVMKRSGEHLLSLINKLLDISRIESGDYKLGVSRFELGSLLESILDMLNQKAQEKGLTLSSSYSKRKHIPEYSQMYIEGDAQALRQILINLLSNAIKFTEKGTVNLHFEILDYKQHKATMRFSITDTGRGIPVKQSAHLFEAFKQVDEKHDLFHGTGMGLFIAQELVRKMGGNIEVKSTVKKGSCFSFSICCPMEFSLASHENLQIVHKDFPVSYSGAKRKLLVVDDIKDNRDVLLDLLTPMGFEIDIAENGQEALKKIKYDVYDLVLSDIIMPFMNGYELIKLIRSNQNIASTRIIAVSANLRHVKVSEKEDVMQFDAFISKPIHVDELLTTIGKLLEIDWVYASEKPDVHTELSKPSINTKKAISLEELLWLAKIGDIAELDKNISSIRPAAPEAYTELRLLLNQFKVHKMAQLLSNLIRSNKNE